MPRRIIRLVILAENGNAMHMSLFETDTFHTAYRRVISTYHVPRCYHARLRLYWRGMHVLPEWTPEELEMRGINYMVWWHD